MGLDLVFRADRQFLVPAGEHVGELLQHHLLSRLTLQGKQGDLDVSHIGSVGQLGDLLGEAVEGARHQQVPGFAPVLLLRSRAQAQITVSQLCQHKGRVPERMKSVFSIGKLDFVREANDPV